MKKLIVVAVFAFFVALPTFAQLPLQPSSSPEEIQKKLQIAIKAEFNDIDLNSDKELSKDEFTEYQAKKARSKAETTFDSFDIDHNGLLSEEEYLAALQNIMQQLATEVQKFVQNIHE